MLSAIGRPARSLAEWDRINRLYDKAVIAKSANEQDRKNEWKILKIVQCLLYHVHSTIVDTSARG